MNLYLFPAPADDKGGYDIAVKDAYIRLQPSSDDIIVWACLSRPTCAKDGDYIVYYHPFKSFYSAKKICSGHLNNEFSYKDLSFLKGMAPSYIHCDDVVFYRAVRKLFPDKMITVRFHNVFSRIYDRVKFLGIDVDWRFSGKMFFSRFLEKSIMLDPLVHKTFLTEEDATYYHLITGNTDYDVWKTKISVKREFYNEIKQIVWFGGIEGHKKYSVKWFLEEIWPSIHQDFPYLEFHLYGRYSEQYHDEKLNVVGHGFYQNKDWPYMDSGLYINPDLMGGGIKIKVQSYLENGIRFISTPFGYEGYEKSFIDDVQCYVVPSQYWRTKIKEIIKDSKSQIN